MEVPVKFEVSVMQVGNSLRITIPKEIAKHLNVKKGDSVELWVDNNHMIVEKLETPTLEDSERKERERKKAILRREGKPLSVPSREKSYV